MGLGDEDKEFLRQLSWVYPADFMAEIIQMAETLITEQLSVGERQNIREIVSTIMTRLQLEAEGGLSAEAEAEAAAKQEAALQAVKEKVLAALAAKHPDLPAGMGPEVIAPLAEALAGNDAVIAGYARQALGSLTDGDAIDELCRLWADSRRADMENWAVMAKYTPASDSKAALYYCITGQWDKYYALDWQDNRPLLAKGYSEATSADRQQFLAAARQSGHSLLLAGLLLKAGVRAEYEEITDLDWAVMLDILSGQERWEELHHLALCAPVSWGAECVLTLAAAAWQPKPWRRLDWENILHCCPQAGKDIFVPDGRQVAVLENIEANVSIDCAAFHPNGRLAAGGGSDGRLRLWHTDGGRLWRTVNLHAEGITAVAFSPDGRYLVTAGRDGKVNSWQLPDVKWAQSVRGQTGAVAALAVDEQSRLLALACAGGVLPAKVWLWDGSDMFIKAQYPGSLFCAAAVNAKARFIAGGGQDGRLRTYVLAGGTGTNKQWLAHNRQIKGLMFSGDGRTLVSNGADGYIKVWQADTGRLLCTALQSGTLLAVSQSGARAIIKSPQGNLILRQLRFSKPLALATHEDWRFVEDRMNDEGMEPDTKQACCFLHNLLTSKFRYDIML